MIGDASLTNPQANGIAANALFVSLMRALLKKGTLNTREAEEVVLDALRDLKPSGANMVKAARDAIEKDILPEFRSS
jgi:polyhydroxyalkanoate synthesis regulator phasin